MTLNGVIAVYSRYFAEFGSFWAYYTKVVKETPIHSASEMQPSGDIRRGSSPARALK